MKKIVLAILFGGCSNEYMISLQSAQAVAENINREWIEPVLIGITPEGEWFRYQGELGLIAADRWKNEKDAVRAAILPTRARENFMQWNAQGMQLMHIDAAMPVMHGKNGEDGAVQGLLQMAGIPIVGCGVLSGALCMDKHRAHQVVQAHGVHVPQGVVVYPETDLAKAQKQADALGYPLFVKPVNSGSSIGITQVLHAAELPGAILQARAHDSEVLLEETIEGFEVGCAVLGNETLITGEIDEVELTGGYFDYTEKYTLQSAKIHVPARIDRAQADAVKETAKRIYRALGCRGFARVDMFLTRNGEIVFNEVNTIPGFTAHSRYAGMMRAAGMAFGEVIERAVRLAVEP